MKYKLIYPQQMLLVLVVGSVFVLCEGQQDLSIAPMEKKEQDSLYLAIQGFIGKWWNGSDLYPDPCGWTPIQGVSCDTFNGFWYVTQMFLGPVYDNSLRCTPKAKFTDHLFELKHLKSLSFFNCFFSTKNPIQIPSSNWENLANTLESLEFRSNQGLISTIPTSLGCLKNLQSLVLLENGLTGTLPIELGSLIKLKRLVLAGNQLTGQILTNFGGLTELLILDLSRNHLSGSIQSIFLGGLTSLLKLDLCNNLLEGKLPNELKDLKNLTLLDLRSNNFSGKLTKSLEEMVSLKEMVISHNPNLGGDLGGIQWKKLQNLEIVDLSDTGLIGTIPESITELGRLRFLGLGDNKLSGSVPPVFANMTSLCSLYVNGNNLTGKLELRDWFYKKMGRRFGAWNNPNLCYNVELISTSTDSVPFGVKPCESKERM